MALPRPQQRLTEAEYLAIERAAGFKSEFFNGEMFAMAGGSPIHSLIAANIIGELRSKLTGARCKVFTSDLRLKVEATAHISPLVRRIAVDPLADSCFSYLSWTFLPKTLNRSFPFFERRRLGWPRRAGSRRLHQHEQNTVDCHHKGDEPDKGRLPLYRREHASHTCELRRKTPPKFYPLAHPLSWRIVSQRRL